jgi:hypothetical protein
MRYRASSIIITILMVMVFMLPAAQPAHAGTTTYGTNLTAGSPTFTRPNSGCSAGTSTVAYDIFEIAVDTTGTYTMEGLAGGTLSDPLLVVYQSSFDPASPTTNCIAWNDDQAFMNFLPLVSTTLTANTPYLLIITTFSSGQYGTVDVKIDGPGNITAGVVGSTSPAAPADPDTCTSDARSNSVCDNPWQTVAIYCQYNATDFYQIKDGHGYLALRVTSDEINSFGAPAEGSSPADMLIAQSEDGAIRLYKLPNGNLQMNGPSADNSNEDYVIIWGGC